MQVLRSSLRVRTWVRQSHFIPRLHDAGIEGLKYLKVSRTAGQVFYLEPNNPPVNALRSEMLSDFEAVASAFEANPPRCIVLRCDVAGANIKEMQAQSPEQSEAYANRAKSAFRRLRDTGSPIVGFTTKFAIGGGLELLMHSDIRYSGPKALLQAPEVELDTYQSFGGTYLLPRFLGSSLALRAQLLSEKIDLADALQHGLITEVVSDPDPNATVARAFKDALTIARKKPSVVRKNVAMVRFSETGDLDEVCKEESRGFGETFAGGALGMRRFLEKYRLEEWGRTDRKVVYGEFKSLGIDTTQINAFLDIARQVQDDKTVQALFLAGDVSGGDIKKLYKALTETPAQFTEFLEQEYLWHEYMRTQLKTRVFFFGGKILGGGGLGVFNSCSHKICSPETVFVMPEIELGACPDVAGTYDLARLGSVGRAMAIAALDLNGNEAKHFGLTDHLVPSAKMEELKEVLLDAVVEGDESAVQDALQRYAVEPEAPRHSLPLFDELFGADLSLEDVVARVLSSKDVEGSLASRAFEKMSKSSSYGIVLADTMHKEGKTLSLREARALEYLVWENMDKDDFKESIHSRFILPRKERHPPRFEYPNIFEISPSDLCRLHTEVQDLLQSVKPKLEGTQALLFSTLE